MKTSILTYTVSLIMTLGTYSCALHEKYDYCPWEDEPNVELFFSLPADDDGSRFGRSITSVYVGIFDRNGYFVDGKYLTSHELAAFRGIRLGLEPGEYYVVCWSNVLGNSSFFGVNGSVHPYGPHVAYSERTGNRVRNADRVFYGPRSSATTRTNSDFSQSYHMKVDLTGGHRGHIEFTEGYRTVQVFIEGFQGSPEVELGGVPEGLTYFGIGYLTDLNGNRRTVTAYNYPVPFEKDGVRYDLAEIDTFYFTDDNDIIISVVDTATGDTAFTMPLNEVIEESGAGDDITISFIFRFTPAGVDVLLPAWDREEITPGLDTRNQRTDNDENKI